MFFFFFSLELNGIIGVTRETILVPPLLYYVYSVPSAILALPGNNKLVL